MPTLRERLAGWLRLRPQPPVPWRGIDVFAGVVFVEVFCPELVRWLLEITHFFQFCYGSDVLAIVRDKPAGADIEQARAQVFIWVNCLALPLQIIGLPLLYYSLAGYRPKKLGLTLRRGWLNAGLGVLAAVVVVPLVLGINLLVNWAFEQFTLVEVQQHPLLQLGKQLRPLDTVALVFAVVVAAPLREELVVRGLLQPWCARRRWRGHLAMTVALVLALLGRFGGISKVLHDGNLSSLLQVELWPAYFVLLMLPGYLLVLWRSRTPTGPALYATALLFAAAHSAVWPTPVALFVLGLGLGYLYQQTQSLVTPVALHALFNGVGCVLWLWW